MSNISDILKLLSQFESIDFSNQKDKFSMLIDKYDKNHNSVFECDELEKLKKDSLSVHKNDNLICDLINIGKQNFIDELSAIRELNPDERSELTRLNVDELKRAKDFLDIKGRKNQFAICDIAKLSKLNKGEIDDVLAQNPNIHIQFSTELYTDLDNGNDYYICNESGMLEHIFKENISDDRTKMTVTDKTLKVKEEIIYRYEIDNVLSENLTYYDDNNNVIKVVMTKRDPNTGILNLFQLDKNKNATPIQRISTNSETGSRIIERNFISPNGDKTEYYCQEDERSKVSNYKITDKQGNNLVNIHQTFEKISENKYFSSINTTENNKDTQVYIIEYTKDGKVKISHNNDEKQNIINLGQMFNSEESMHKLLPVIKKIPGHILLKLFEKPIEIEYKNNDYYYTHSGNWYKEKMIIGDFEDVVDEEQALLNTMLHEFGHYTDLYSADSPVYSQNEQLIKIYQEEFEIFQKNTTLIQQKYVDYLTTSGEECSAQERFADTYEMMYTSDCSERSMRRLYFAQYFPRTIAKIMELLTKEL